jgi:metal-responsive CopG/Arc/MetJ family transcriptional regulator
MRMIRLNITLPEEIIKLLEEKKNKSRYIAEALKEKIEREEREKIEKLMKEGYSATAREDKELADEWEKTDIEEWD